jgi:hypothetical protein
VNVPEKPDGKDTTTFLFHNEKFKENLKKIGIENIQTTTTP